MSVELCCAQYLKVSSLIKRSVFQNFFACLYVALCYGISVMLIFDTIM